MRCADFSIHNALKLFGINEPEECENLSTYHVKKAFKNVQLSITPLQARHILRRFDSN